MIRYCIETNLSTLLHGDSAALPVGDLPALLVCDLPAVRLGHVPAVVDGDGLAVVAGLEALALAVRRQQHVTPVGGLAGLHVICNTGQSGAGRDTTRGLHKQCSGTSAGKVWHMNFETQSSLTVAAPLGGWRPLNRESREATILSPKSKILF